MGAGKNAAHIGSVRLVFSVRRHHVNFDVRRPPVRVVVIKPLPRNPRAHPRGQCSPYAAHNLNFRQFVSCCRKLRHVRFYGLRQFSI